MLTQKEESIFEQLNALAEKLSSTLSPEFISMTSKHTQFTVRQSKITGLYFFRMVMFDHLMSEQPSLQQHGFSISDCRKKVSK